VAYLVGRAADQARDAVRSAIAALVAQGELAVEAEAGGQFYSIPGTAAAPRRPGGEPLRPSARIAASEYDAGVLLVCELLRSAQRNELVQEAARQFGFERTSGQLSAALHESIDRLIADRRLAEQSDGALTVIQP
jgi:hypothetical protein